MYCMLIKVSLQAFFGINHVQSAGFLMVIKYMNFDVLPYFVDVEIPFVCKQPKLI
jgi:hypothetical protein